MGATGTLPPAAVSSAAPSHPSTALDEALALQLQAMALEDHGDMASALVLYKRAARLDPGVDFRANQHFCAAAPAAPAASTGASRPGRDQAAPPHGDDDNDNDADDTAPALPAGSSPLEELQQPSAAAAAEPAQPLAPGDTHIAQLPRELLRRIFVAALPRDRDLAVYAVLARVCRHWHAVMASDEALWRAVARRLWTAAVRPEPLW
jgi:hypothetical protein